MTFTLRMRTLISALLCLCTIGSLFHHTIVCHNSNSGVMCLFNCRAGTGAAVAAACSITTSNSSAEAISSSCTSRNSSRNSSSSASNVALLAAAVQDSINAKQQFKVQ
jgi:hypothetical protein